MFKKMILAVSIIAMLSTNLVLAAVTDPTLTLGSVSTNVGATFEVPITVSNFTDVVGMQFNVVYDSTKMTYTGYTMGSVATGFTATVNPPNTLPIPNNGTISVVLDGGTPINTAGVIMNLSFTATTVATSNITFAATPREVVNSTATHLSANYNPGVATIAAANHAPVITAAGNQTTTKNVTKAMTVTYTDSDSADTHTINISSNNANVTVANKSGNVSGSTYNLVPATDFTGTATITVTVTDNSGQTNATATDTYTFTVNAPAANTITVTAFTATPSTGFDAAPLADNETLSISYTLSIAPDSTTIEIKDPSNNVVYTYNPTGITNSISWNGKYGNKLAEPGIYKAVLTAAKQGYTNGTSEISFTVAYAHSSKPAFSGITVSPAKFDSDDGDTIIDFTNTNASYITVEIRKVDGTLIKAFSSYENTSYTSNRTHSLVWNGKNDANSKVSNGTYNVVIVGRNDYGVTVTTTTVQTDDSLSSASTSNAHLSGISFSPSSTYKPEEDDELTIEYDVLQDLDSLKINAVRGDQTIEISDESSINKETNLEATWDGMDSDENHVDAGSWRIEFTSKVGSTELKASKTIIIKYDEPSLDEVYISKDKIDNDQNESLYIIFRTNDPANINIYSLIDGEEDENIVEDMEVEADKWYAVQWDGGGYNYDDKVSIEIRAENMVNENVYDSITKTVDLAEDNVSSSKSNVTQDSIYPVASTGYESMELSYNIDETADVTVTIHKGKTSSGTNMVELLNVKDQESGDHVISWDGKDKNGSKLADGVYTYKIVSKKTSTDTETGLFVIGKVGEIDGDSSSSSSDSSSSSSSSSGHANVIVDGGDNNNQDTSSNNEDTNTTNNQPSSSAKCEGFSDVLENSTYCDAIAWAKLNDIFSGYNDNTFRPYQPINRVEILKVILEALNINTDSSSALLGNQGFVDVDSKSWYMPYIKKAKELGIFTGDAGKKTARPADPVNRAEFLKFIFESLRIANGFNFSYCPASSLSDVPSNAWYVKYACEASNYNLFNSSELNSLSAGNSATRGEIVKALYDLHVSGLF